MTVDEFKKYLLTLDFSKADQKGKTIETYSKSEDELLGFISTDTFKQYLEKNQDLHVDFNTIFYRILGTDRKVASVWRNINVSEDYYDKIRNDTKRSKDTVLKIIIGLKCNLQQAEELLSADGYKFGNNDIKDQIIKAHIINKDYEIGSINALLDKYNIKKLFSDN